MHSQISGLHKVSSGRNWQKICDASDWDDPLFKYVLREIFSTPRSFHRKQWEFVCIFLALAEKGMFDGAKTGLSFGAGKESLLFYMARFVDKIVATDLYSSDTNWQEARVKIKSTLKEAVLAASPIEVDADRIDVEHMNMLDLTYPDASFDFCYSSSVFEHIGHDDAFVQHLREARRVLRPDGVYALTTEYLFHDEVWPIKGNYKFNVAYLDRLAREAGFQMEATFDCRLDTRSMLNRPTPRMDHFPLGDRFKRHMPHAVLIREGFVYTSLNCILTPSPGGGTSSPTETVGSKEAFAFGKKMRGVSVRSMFRQWCAVDPFCKIRRTFKEALSKLELRAPNTLPFELLAEHKQPVFMRTGPIFLNHGKGQVRCVLNIPGATKNPAGKVVVRVEERDRNRELRVKVVAEQTRTLSELTQDGFFLLEFDAQADRTYEAVGSIPIKAIKKNPSAAIEISSLEIRVLNS